MKRTVKKLRRNFQDYGLGVTLGKVCSGALAFACESRTYRIYRIKLDRYVPAELDTGGFELRLLDQEENSLIDQIEGLEEWLFGEIREKLKTGSICLVALEGEQVAGFNLVSFGEIYMPLVNMTRKFRDNEAWSEQITVSKNFRGRGLAATLRLTVFDVLKDRGVNRFYGGTLPLNLANRKLSKKVGFREIADIRYRRFLNKKTWAFKRIGQNDKAI